MIELGGPPPPPLTRAELDNALVEGDRLLVAGDPRGELMVVSARVAEQPTAELLAREAQLYEAHLHTWLGGAMPEGIGFQWRLGKIDAIAINLLWIDDSAALLRRLLTSPAGRDLRALRAFGYPRHRGSSRSRLPDTYYAVDEVLRYLRPPLRELVLDFHCDPDWDMGDPGFGLMELGATWTALPKLEHVALQSLFVDLELGDEASYRHLTARSYYGLESVDVEAIARARWPVLDTLCVSLARASVDAVLALLEGRHMPGLVHLELAEAPATIIEAIATSAILPRLETLAVSWGGYHVYPREPPPRVATNDRAFAHLRRFDLDLGAPT